MKDRQEDAYETPNNPRLSPPVYPHDVRRGTAAQGLYTRAFDTVQVCVRCVFQSAQGCSSEDTSDLQPYWTSDNDDLGDYADSGVIAWRGWTAAQYRAFCANYTYGLENARKHAFRSFAWNEDGALAPIVQDIPDLSAVTDRYRAFVQRLDDGRYRVDCSAPFAHRLDVFVAGSSSFVASQEDMATAMAAHERQDKVFNLSEGLAFTLTPLEETETEGITGTIRLVFSLTLTLIPMPHPAQESTPDVDALSLDDSSGSGEI